MSKPILWIVIPCYNEEAVLPITAPLFLQKINDLAARGLVSDRSRVLFVNDGSKDKTWELIQGFAKQDEHFIGIAQSRNRGHQNAVLAGLMEALHSGSCDITISIDCDGQDDINAMDEMVQKYLDGAEVVYGVRSRRDTDTFFKRFTAEGFYHVMNALGADIVFNHADYRLISTRVLESFADYHEVNIFLRGMVPLVGFPHDVVTYERHERLAGESHYPLSKMLALAFDGITSLSNKPIRISVRPERFSHHLIQESGQFAINLPTEALVRSVDWCGVKSGRDVDKFAACGLHAEPGSVLTDCPVLAESPVNLECKVTQRIPLGSHDLFLAEVVACDVDESLLDETGKLCLDKAKLIVYSHGEYLALGKKLGTFGYTVRKKKPARKKK